MLIFAENINSNRFLNLLIVRAQKELFFLLKVYFCVEIFFRRDIMIDFLLLHFKHSSFYKVIISDFINKEKG